MEEYFKFQLKYVKPFLNYKYFNIINDELTLFDKNMFPISSFNFLIIGFIHNNSYYWIDEKPHIICNTQIIPKIKLSKMISKIDNLDKQLMNALYILKGFWIISFDMNDYIFYVLLL